MKHLIQSTMEEPQENGLYLIFEIGGKYKESFYRHSTGRWQDLNGDYWKWQDMVRRYSRVLYCDIESLASHDARIRDEVSTQNDADVRKAYERPTVTFTPDLLAQKLSADGEYVMVESDDNDSFSCSNCGCSLQKDGWFTHSIPDFHYCPNCGGKVKEV